MTVRLDGGMIYHRVSQGYHFTMRPVGLYHRSRIPPE